MTTSSLYHTQGTRGYKYQMTLRVGETTVFLSNGTLSSTGIKKLFLWTIPSIFAFIR